MSKYTPVLIAVAAILAIAIGFAVYNLLQHDDHPDFIGFKKDGWLWGCLYKKKTDGSIYTFIDAESIDEFEVITPENGCVLFRRQKNE